MENDKSLEYNEKNLEEWKYLEAHPQQWAYISEYFVREGNLNAAKKKQFPDVYE